MQEMCRSHSLSFCYCRWPQIHANHVATYLLVLIVNITKLIGLLCLFQYKLLMCAYEVVPCAPA